MKVRAWLLIFLATMVAGGARAQVTRDGAGVARVLPKPAIILFWADWCAPCRVEVRMIAQLDEAAGSIPVIVVPMESGRRTREALAGVNSAHVRYVRSNPYVLLRTLAGDTAGLPVSVAIDRAGTTCAVKQGAITVGEIHAWVLKCARPPVG